MKKTTSPLIFTLIQVSLNQNTTGRRLKDDFQNPVQQHQSGAWWRWLNWSNSKDRISKELEVIKDKGMNRVTLFNLGGKNAKSRVLENSVIG